MNARSIVFVLAILAFASAGSAQPANPIADAERTMEQGVDAEARGDHEAALAFYLHAAVLVPNANLPHRYAGDALVALDRRTEAIASYERYLTIKPDVSDAMVIDARIRALQEERVSRR